MSVPKSLGDLVMRLSREVVTLTYDIVTTIVVLLELLPWLI